jgi:hypothetical protein
MSMLSDRFRSKLTVQLGRFIADMGHLLEQIPNFLPSPSAPLKPHILQLIPVPASRHNDSQL